MKILIIHQYFNVPESGGPLRSYYLAQGLQDHGYEVEVITAHNHSKEQSKNITGIKVHYLPVYYDNRLGFWRRIWAFVKFAKLAFRKACAMKNVDWCYAISTPLTVGWIALRLKSKRHVPYIFEVGDLWPEAPIQMGALKNPWLISLLRKFESRIYEQAQRVVALSPGIREGVLRAAPDCRTVLVPNMSDCDYFSQQNLPSTYLKTLGLKDKFVIIYFGAAGRANHLEYLVDAARSSQQFLPSVHFLVAARGSRLKHIKQQAHHLTNLTFLDYLPKDKLKEVLGICDAVYVSYANVPILNTGSPNKFFDGLAAGKLMILNFKGWLKEFAENKELGIYCDPNQPQLLVQQLAPFLKDPALLLKYQQNARRAAELHFSKEMAIQKIVKTLDNDQKMPAKGSLVYTLTA